MDDTATQIAQKINLTFAKTGAAIFLSHLDLVRHFSRMLRRAALRPRLTSGFNPRARVVFPHALPLGVISDCETAEIEFCENAAPQEIFSALKAADRGVLELRRLEIMRPIKAGQIVERCAYTISGIGIDANTAAARQKICEELSANETLTVWRGEEAKRREVDIRPYLETLVCAENSLNLILRHTETGAGRIDDFAKIFAAKMTDAEHFFDWRNWQLHKTAAWFKPQK